MSETRKARPSAQLELFGAPTTEVLDQRGGRHRRGGQRRHLRGRVPPGTVVGSCQGCGVELTKATSLSATAGEVCSGLRCGPCHRLFWATRPDLTKE